MLCEAVIAEGAQVEVEDDVIRQAAVDGEDGNFVLFVVPHGDGLDVGDIGEIDGIVLCGGEHRLERNAASVFGGVKQRIINRLAPCGAVFFGHDGCDDIDELCHARHFYAVGVLHQRDEHEADEQGVFKIVVVFEQVRRDLPRAVLHGVGIGGIGVEPDVPFVEAEVDVFLCALLRLDEIARGDDGADEVIHVVALGEEVCGIVEAVAVVLVQGDVIDTVIRPSERGVFPLRECGHARVGAAAEHEFDGRVNLFHGFGGLVGKVAVFVGGLVAGLPRAVHFIAEAPDFDVVRVFDAVLDTQVAVFGAGRVVAVFEQVARCFNAACAEVDGLHDLRVGFFHPLCELVDADIVRLCAAPCKLKTLRAVFYGAYAVFPVEIGDEVAAGVTDDRHLQLAHEVEYIAAEAVFIGSGVARLPDAAVYCTAEVLDERAVDALIDFRNLEVLFNGEFCLFCHRPDLSSKVVCTIYVFILA